MFATRGIQHCIDLWHTQMQSVWLPFPRKNLDVCGCGRTLKEHEAKDCPCKEFKPRAETTNIQLALRPVQLWEAIFPHDCLDIVLNSLEIKPKGITEPAALNKYAWLMRKGMGLKSIPDEIKPSQTFPVFHSHIHFFPIGIKDDIIEDCDFKAEGKWHQERL